MANPFTNPKATTLESSFKPWYSSDPNQFYSAYQNMSQHESEAMYRQFPLGKMIIDAQTRMVIGKGLTPMSSPESDITGWDRETTEKFTRQAEAYWRLVTGSRNYDWYGKNAPCFGWRSRRSQYHVPKAHQSQALAGIGK